MDLSFLDDFELSRDDILDNASDSIEDDSCASDEDGNNESLSDDVELDVNIDGFEDVLDFAFVDNQIDTGFLPYQEENHENTEDNQDSEISFMGGGRCSHAGCGCLRWTPDLSSKYCKCGHLYSEH